MRIYTIDTKIVGTRYRIAAELRAIARAIEDALLDDDALLEKYQLLEVSKLLKELGGEDSLVAKANDTP